MAKVNVNPDVTIDRIREVLSYDPRSGIFRRRSTDWPTGCAKNTYIRIKIDGKLYAAHRLAWIYMTGAWPKKYIDHIDGDKHNNRFSNLRDVSNAENMQNLLSALSNNRSGLIGAAIAGKRGFEVRIQVYGTQHFIGYFPTAEAAHVAYVTAKRQMHKCGNL